MKVFNLTLNYNSREEIVNGNEGKAIIAELRQGEIDEYAIRSINNKYYKLSEDLKTIVEIAEGTYAKNNLKVVEKTATEKGDNMEENIILNAVNSLVAKKLAEAKEISDKVVSEKEAKINELQAQLAKSEAELEEANNKYKKVEPLIMALKSI